MNVLILKEEGLSTFKEGLYLLTRNFPLIQLNFPLLQYNFQLLQLSTVYNFQPLVLLSTDSAGSPQVSTVLERSLYQLSTDVERFLLFFHCYQNDTVSFHRFPWAIYGSSTHFPEVMSSDFDRWITVTIDHVRFIPSSSLTVGYSFS